MIFFAKNHFFGIFFCAIFFTISGLTLPLILCKITLKSPTLLHYYIEIYCIFFQ